MIYIIKSEYIRFNTNVLYRLFIQLISALYIRYAKCEIITANRPLTCPAILPKFEMIVKSEDECRFNELSLIVEKNTLVNLPKLILGLEGFNVMFMGIEMAKVEVRKYPNFVLEINSDARVPTFNYAPVVESKKCGCILCG